MTDRGASPNEFEQDRPGTQHRTRYEAMIEGVRQRGGVFVGAIRASRLPMVLTDPNLPGNPIVFANEAFLRLSGYAMEEVLGQQPHFLNGPDTDPEDAARFQQILAEDRDGAVETVQYAKDGRRFVATVLLSAFNDADGRTLHRFLSWTDVTRRVAAEDELALLHRTQEALRESEGKYRTLFETLGQGFIELEVIRDEHDRPVDLRYLELNPAFERQFGIPIAEARGARASEFFPGFDPDWTEAFDRVARTGQAERIEHTFAGDRWFEVFAYPAPGGRVRALCEDISERVRGEQKLRESEERQAFLLELSDTLRPLSDPFDIQTAAMKLLAHHLDVFRAGYLEGEADGDTFTMSARFERNAPSTPESIRLSDYGPDLAEAFRAGHTQFVCDTEDETHSEQQRVAYRAIHVRSWIIAPLVKSGRLTAIVGVVDQIPRQWRPSDILLVTELAERTWEAAERARAEALLRETHERQSFLLTVNDALRSISDPTEMQSTAARMVAERLGVSRAGYGEVEGDEIAVRADFAQGFPSMIGRYPVDAFGPAIANVYRHGGLAVIRDVANDPDLSPAARDRLRAAQIAAHVTCAIRKDEQAVISFGVHSDVPRDWTEGEIALIREVAERTWASIARAEAATRLSEEQLAAELHGTELLRRLAERLVTEDDSQTIYEEILGAAMAITRSDGGTVQLYEPSTHSLVLLITNGMPRNITEHFHRVDADSHTACGIALRTGTRTFIDFDQETDEACRMHVVAGYRSAQATPILSRSGAPLGMLNTHWRAAGHRPSERELRLLDLLARQAADLIEAREAREALRESEERLRRFGEASQDVLWIRDAKTLQWTYLTPAFETIYGLSREDALKGENFTNWLKLIVPEDRARAEACIAKVRAGEHVTFEYRIRRPDGALRWLRNTDFPIRDAGRKIALFGGIGQDVTGLKRTETSLRESEERLRLIVENAADYAIFTTDPAGVCTDWREGAEAVFGYTREEMIGSSGDILFTPEDRANGEPDKERATATETGKAGDVRWHMRKDGSRVFIDGVSTALRGSDGTLLGFLKIGQDVTERHASEQRQALLLAELQHRVRNTLGMIRSMVRFTADGHEDIEDFTGHLVGRLDALARTQVVLTRTAGARVDLHSMVWDELEVQSVDEQRVKVAGPEVSLSPKAAEVLSLALHELATNSLKYGALADPDGRLTVKWELAASGEDRWLRLGWEERSPNARPQPARVGFGTELIQERVPYELNGEASLRIADGGVTAEIAFPLAEGASILETTPVKGSLP